MEAEVDEDEEEDEEEDEYARGAHVHLLMLDRNIHFVLPQTNSSRIWVAKAKKATLFLVLRSMHA